MRDVSSIRISCLSAIAALMFLFSPAIAMADADSVSKSLDDEIQALKQAVVSLNRDLYILEEELLYPSNTQLAVFVSVDTGKYFSLDAVELKIDDKTVANHLYTQRDVDALHRGGVQRIYMGNLKAGRHELVALYTGKGPHGRDYRRGATYSFDKNLGTKYVEIKIIDNTSSERPDFSIKDWE